MESDSSDVDDRAHVAMSPGNALAVPSSPPISNPQERENIKPSSLPFGLQPILDARIANDPYAQGEDGETYFRRANRYFGPASTWLSWTEEERNTAIGVERTRSQDLSAHLFNSFKLKHPDSKEAQKLAKRYRKGKERSDFVDAQSDEDDGAGLEPPTKKIKFGVAKSWTAWPLPPDEVPREQLLAQMYPDGLRQQVDDRRATNLEEWLVATATEIARDRWDMRRWEQEERLVPGLKANEQNEHAEGTDRKTLPGTDSMEGVQDTEVLDGDDETLSPTRPMEAEVFFSQPFAFYDDDEDNSRRPVNGDSDSDENEADRRPVLLADEDKARRVFLPSARHILSKLDDLLISLHKSRYSYASKPQGRARGRSSQSQTPGNSRSRGRSLSRDVSRRRVARSSSANSAVSNASHTSSHSGKHSRRVARLGLRDWSDVVGMASLAGWDSAVVERASERCAKLFCQNMAFRTFHEGDGKEGRESHFENHLADETESDAASEEVEGEPEEDALLVARLSRPCTACQASRLQCVPMDNHTGNFKACKNCVVNGTTCSGIRVGSLDAARVCPHESCPRHTIPFLKNYGLQRHLDRVHGPNARSVPSSRSRTTSIAPNDVSSPQSGSDTTNNIVCPVKGCPRHKPFSKGKKLYEHIRRMHPEVDVEQVKKKEAEKRHRQRGRSQSRGLSRGRSLSQAQRRRRSQPTLSMPDATMQDSDQEERDRDGDEHADEDIKIQSSEDDTDEDAD